MVAGRRQVVEDDAWMPEQVNRFTGKPNTAGDRRDPD